MKKILIISLLSVISIGCYSQKMTNEEYRKLDSTLVSDSIKEAEIEADSIEAVEALQEAPKHIIRGEFFGFSFEDGKETVMKCFEGNGIHCYENEGNLNTDGVYFCRRSFSYSEEMFYKNRLYEINFVSRFSNLISARSLYYQMKKEFNSNYKCPFSNFKTGRTYYGINGNSCSVSIEYSESKGGKKYYYVTLSYWNENLYNEYDKENKL